jgi:hypothetical protein
MPLTDENRVRKSQKMYQALNIKRTRHARPFIRLFTLVKHAKRSYKPTKKLRSHSPHSADSMPFSSLAS